MEKVQTCRHFLARFDANGGTPRKVLSVGVHNPKNGEIKSYCQNNYSIHHFKKNMSTPILMTMVMAGVAIAAMMAANGFKGRPDSKFIQCPLTLHCHVRNTYTTS
jgi:hypothetical protein